MTFTYTNVTTINLNKPRRKPKAGVKIHSREIHLRKNKVLLSEIYKIDFS